MTEHTIGIGKLVGFTYSIKDDQDSIVEHSDMPITYVHGGKHQIFNQIEAALEGRKLDDLVEVPIASKDAFGPHDPNLTFTDDLENAPEEHRVVGAELDMENDKGETLHFRVTSIKDGKITIDANHPLAGKDITFVVKVREVRLPNKEELKDQPGFGVN